MYFRGKKHKNIKSIKIAEIVVDRSRDLTDLSRGVNVGELIVEETMPSGHKTSTGIQMEVSSKDRLFPLKWKTKISYSTSLTP